VQALDLVDAIPDVVQQVIESIRLNHFPRSLKN